MTNLNLETVEERLAKAKEEAEFWEKARSVLADPRLQALTAPPPHPISLASSTFTPVAAPRAYGELKNRVHSVLPGADKRAALTTQKIVKTLQDNGYVFTAKDPPIAVNGALVALEAEGLAQCTGKFKNAKLWQKGTPKNQEAPEGAS